VEPTPARAALQALAKLWALVNSYICIAWGQGITEEHRAALTVQDLARSGYQLIAEAFKY
jgi:hypothetical protein